MLNCAYENLFKKAAYFVDKEAKKPLINSEKIVIEGVENEKQLEFAKSKDIDYIQGYYFTKPLKEDDLNKFLKEKNK